MKLTLYYAPWCGHSVNILNNGWKNMPDSYKGVKIEKLDCTVKENKEMVDQLKVLIKKGNNESQANL